MKKTFIALLFLCIFAFMPFTNVKAEIAPMIESKDLYQEKIDTIEVFAPQTNDVYVTDDEVYLMAQVVFAESRSEPFEGKVAVASVILNRMKDPHFPHTVKGVVMQKDAFSCVRNGKIDVVPDESSYKAVLAALKGNDPTAEAVFYYNPKIATDKWMKNISKRNVKIIGNHVFFVAG